MANFAAGPATPVAVNVTGGMSATVAVREFVPATVPNVQPPTVATPDAFVSGVAPVSVPPPATTANTTVTPDTGSPVLVSTTTLGNTGAGAPAGAVAGIVTAVRTAAGVKTSVGVSVSDLQATADTRSESANARAAAPLTIGGSYPRPRSGCEVDGKCSAASCRDRDRDVR